MGAGAPVAVTMLALSVSGTPCLTWVAAGVSVVVVAAVVTVAVTAAVAATLVFMASPEYVAVMLFTPTGKLLNTRLATPLLPLACKVTLPSSVLPLKKLTVPVGTLLPYTLAVNVMGLPTVALAGLGVDRLTPPVPCKLTAFAAEVLLALLVSPKY